LIMDATLAIFLAGLLTLFLAMDPEDILDALRDPDGGSFGPRTVAAGAIGVALLMLIWPLVLAPRILAEFFVLYVEETTGERFGKVK